MSDELHLRVDPVACDAFGYCAELLPELVGLDEWGYPIVSGRPVPPPLVDLARRAVADCPRRALVLQAQPRSTRVVLATTRREKLSGWRPAHPGGTGGGTGSSPPGPGGR